MAQTHRRYRVRHDSSTRTILRNLSLYAHRYGRVDGRDPYGCCRCNPASYFPATGGRRWYPDTARDRQPRRAGDGLRCRNGLVCRPDLCLNLTHPAASTLNTQRKAARTGLPAGQLKTGLVRIDPGSSPLQPLTGPDGVTTGLAFHPHLLTGQLVAGVRAGLIVAIQYVDL